MFGLLLGYVSVVPEATDVVEPHFLVDWLTHLGGVKNTIMVAKFADRLSNLSRMGDWPGDWQEDYLRESCFWPKAPWKNLDNNVEEK